MRGFDPFQIIGGLGGAVAEVIAEESKSAVKFKRLALPDVNVSKVGKIAGKPGELYQAEEHFFKMAVFVNERAGGATVEQASAHAQKHLFNYGELSPRLKRLRRTPLGGPFLTFTAKSLPIIAESAVKHPLRFWKWPLMFNAFNEMSKNAIGMSDEEEALIQSSLPEWQKSTAEPAG